MINVINAICTDHYELDQLTGFITLNIALIL